MVVFDATMLMLLIRPDSGRPIDPSTGDSVGHIQERIAHFVAQSDKSKVRIGLPTPALSEALVRSGTAAVKVVEKIKEFSVFEILPFDEISAIEVAILTKNALDLGDKRGGSGDIWNKVKYDRQIAAIAKVRQATAIYTDDAGLRSVAAQLNITTVGIVDLVLPPEKAQGVLPLDAITEQTSEPTIEEIEQAQEAESVSPGTT